MVAIEKLHRVLFIYLLIGATGCSYQRKKSYPKIGDLVSFKQEYHPLPPHVILKNFDMDISKLDIHKLRKNDTSFRRHIMGEFLATEDHAKNRRNLRKITESTTQVPGGVPYFNDSAEYFRAYELQYRTKMADVMLQLIYMARHKVTIFERGNASCNQTSAHYRMAVIMRKLAFLYHQAQLIMQFMLQKQSKMKWDTESNSILSLHEKVSIIHVDFTYLFMAQMNLNAQEENRRHEGNQGKGEGGEGEGNQEEGEGGKGEGNQIDSISESPNTSTK